MGSVAQEATAEATAALLTTIQGDNLPSITDQHGVTRWRTVCARYATTAGDLFKLSLILVRHLGVGWKWALSLAQLIGFATLLMPGFMRVMAFYYFSRKVKRGILYGPKPRNDLDMYLPSRRSTASGPYPVAVFVTGGAWIIGYKAWGALLARRLSENGVLVCCLDYRNFPQGTMQDMLEDTNMGIRWVNDNIADYGGDPHNMFIIGQSAGAQLATLALMYQARSLCMPHNGFGSRPSWPLANIRGFVGISGAYDIPALTEHLHRRGLYKNVFDRIMSIDGQTALESFSPLHVLNSSPSEARNLLPPFMLVHGSGDVSVPFHIAEGLANALQEHDVPAEVREYVGKSHTQPLIEDPFHGGEDGVLDDCLDMVFGGHKSMRQPQLAPTCFIDLATKICPF